MKEAVAFTSVSCEIRSQQPTYAIEKSLLTFLTRTQTQVFRLVTVQYVRLTKSFFTSLVVQSLSSFGVDKRERKHDLVCDIDDELLRDFRVARLDLADANCKITSAGVRLWLLNANTMAHPDDQLLVTLHENANKVKEELVKGFNLEIEHGYGYETLCWRTYNGLIMSLNVDEGDEGDVCRVTAIASSV